MANNKRFILNIVDSIFPLASDEHDLNASQRRLAVLSNDGIDQHIDER